MGLLAGKRVVVTGAARGIGRGIAELFLEQGACVMGGDLLPIEWGGAHADRFAAMLCDVAIEEDVAALIAAAQRRFGGIDCLVNNAGAPGSCEGFETLPVAEFDRTVAIVLRGAFLGIHHVAAIMRTQGGGTIINIGSTSALRASATLHAYGAAKAGVAMLTQNAAVELAPHGIRVNCLCPGGIATAMYGISAGLEAEEAVQRLDIIAGNLARAQPLGRAGTPGDVAQAALWLASDLARYVTGQIIAVDGGMSVGRPLPPGVSAAQFFRGIAGVPA